MTGPEASPNPTEQILVNRTGSLGFEHAPWVPELGVTGTSLQTSILRLRTSTATGLGIQRKMPCACVDILTTRGDSDLENEKQHRVVKERRLLRLTTALPGLAASQFCPLPCLSPCLFGKDEDTYDKGYLEDL